MERHGDEVHIETDEARSGSTPHVVRYMLIVGLALAIAALSAIWIIGALRASQDAQDGPAIHKPVSYEPSRLP